MSMRVAGRADLAANGGALAASILFGASIVAVRVAVRDIPPTTLAVFRFGLGAIVLIGGMSLLRPDLVQVGWRRLRFIALLGAIVFSVFPLTFNAGLQYTQASRGGLMLATMPIWSMVLARLFPTQVAVYINVNPVVAAILGVWLLSERATPVFLLSFAAVMAGVALVNWPLAERARLPTATGTPARTGPRIAVPNKEGGTNGAPHARK